MNTFQLLNGLTFAALLFVVASGFTLIFGLLRIVNLAHGALYLFGGYVGFTIASKTGNTVFLTIRSGNDSVTIDRRIGSFPIQVLSLEVENGPTCCCPVFRYTVTWY